MKKHCQKRGMNLRAVEALKKANAIYERKERGMGSNLITKQSQKRPLLRRDSLWEKQRQGLKLP